MIQGILQELLTVVCNVQTKIEDQYVGNTYAFRVLQHYEIIYTHVCVCFCQTRTLKYMKTVTDQSAF
jgi:hypothetical protein